MLNGKPFSARGQTTLMLNKVGDNWLIVHNHTAQICPERSRRGAQTRSNNPRRSTYAKSPEPLSGCRIKPASGS